MKKIIADTFQTIMNELDSFVNEIKDKPKTFDLKNGREVVSNYDLNLEEKIVAIIKQSFPTHNIFAEEAEYEKTNSEYTWYIDPIDNTVGFLAGEKEVVTSISLKNGDEYIESLIFSWPDLKAYLASDMIAETNQDELKYRYKGVSTCVYVSEKRFNTANKFYNSVMKKRLGLRMSGSAAHDLLQVALKRRYAHVSLAAHPWDVEGGLHLVKQSGGYIKILKYFNEIECYAFIAGVNQHVVEELAKLIEWD